MRIESVTVAGFGPLAHQTLELAPGLTVVCGDNESGKSSWHAATFAALCGRRRGRGRPSVDEQRFVDAHEPWHGGPWAVGCQLMLDDGRLIELRQDLAGKVDCRATDVVLARDVSAEIMVEGSPDASAWLGLARSGLPRTACVGQAEVLRVLDAADGLQHSLQQAASTAGTSGTAAAAIELNSKLPAVGGRSRHRVRRPAPAQGSGVVRIAEDSWSAREAHERTRVGRHRAGAAGCRGGSGTRRRWNRPRPRWRSPLKRCVRQSASGPAGAVESIVVELASRPGLVIGGGLSRRVPVGLLIASAVLGSISLAGLGVVLAVVAGLLAFGTGGTQ